MARIELRNCSIYLRDGLAGGTNANQAVTPAKTAVAAGATTFTVSGTDIPNARNGLTAKIPVGARFTIAGETTPLTHVVTARDVDTDTTGSVTFTPALGPGTYTTDAAVTLLPQNIKIKIGEGDLKWAENSQYKYDLDRGLLDEVRDGDEVPIDVTTNFTFDQIKSGTGEVITPIEAVKGADAAGEWISSDPDSCQPYAVDMIVTDVRPCATVESATYLFPTFRSEKRDFDIKNATVSISGKCNVTEPVITRGVVSF
jgi:hypothetical protein